MRDGRARAARAQLHDPLQGHVGQPAREGRGEAGDVGVVAGRSAVLEDDGVDRAERLGLRGERVQVPDDQLLARVGDVQPVEAQVPGGPHQLSDRLGADTERVDVDEPVHIAQALPVGLPLVQRRAQRGPDAGCRSVRRDTSPWPRGPPEPTTNVRTSTLAISAVRLPGKAPTTAPRPPSRICGTGRTPKDPREPDDQRRRTGTTRRADPRRRPHPGRDPRRGDTGVRAVRLRRCPRRRDRRPHPHHQADDLLLLRRQGAALHGRSGAGVHRDPRGRAGAGRRAPRPGRGDPAPRGADLRPPRAAPGLHPSGQHREHPRGRAHHAAPRSSAGSAPRRST